MATIIVTEGENDENEDSAREAESEEALAEEVATEVADALEDDSAVDAVVAEAVIDQAETQGEQTVLLTLLAEELRAQRADITALRELIAEQHAADVETEIAALERIEDSEPPEDVPSDEEPNDERVRPTSQGPHPLFKPWPTKGGN